MNSDYDAQSPDNPDLARTSERLSAARVEPDALTLDRALTSARARAARRRGPAGGYLRSKVAIAAVLTSGLALSGTGVTLAFQGPSGNGSASSAQYAPAVPGSEGENSAPGTEQEQGSTPQGEEETLSSNPAAGGDEGEGSVQGKRQVAATGDESGDRLPFTGLAAIPLIALGLAMLIAGVVLQRRTSTLRS